MSSNQDIVYISKGEYLIRENEESTQMYYLESGAMEVFKRKGDREEKIGEIHAGEVVGEMSFLDNEPRCASVRASETCKLIIIPSEKFTKVVKELPSWYRTLVNTLLERLRTANRRIKV